MPLSNSQRHQLVTGAKSQPWMKSVRNSIDQRNEKRGCFIETSPNGNTSKVSHTTDTCLWNRSYVNGWLQIQLLWRWAPYKCTCVAHLAIRQKPGEHSCLSNVVNTYSNVQRICQRESVGRLHVRALANHWSLSQLTVHCFPNWCNTFIRNDI